MPHTPVLLRESIDSLNIHQSGVYVDSTYGGGGHSKAILSVLEHGVLVAIDADPEAFLNKEALQSVSEATVHTVCDNFKNISSILDLLHIEKVDGILADLGWRMEQFSGNGKGFSFIHNEPLIMTYGEETNYPFTAEEVINSWTENDLVNVFVGYGEERFPKRIAKAIVTERRKHPIKTTHDLVEVIVGAVPHAFKSGRIHPATRIFQALRILVNDELGVIEQLIKQSVQRLNLNGRLSIITFHSIEDRIVKQLFRTYVESGKGSLMTKKPVCPTREEIIQNPRSRSAKLRTLIITS